MVAPASREVPPLGEGELISAPEGAVVVGAGVGTGPSVTGETSRALAGTGVGSALRETGSPVMGTWDSGTPIEGAAVVAGSRVGPSLGGGVLISAPDGAVAVGAGVGIRLPGIGETSRALGGTGVGSVLRETGSPVTGTWDSGTPIKGAAVVPGSRLGVEEEDGEGVAGVVVGVVASPTVTASIVQDMALRVIAEKDSGGEPRAK